MHRKKGMVPLIRGIARVQLVRGVCGTHTRSDLVRVSDQRGACLVERPVKGALCLKHPLFLV